MQRNRGCGIPLPACGTNRRAWPQASSTNSRRAGQAGNCLGTEFFAFYYPFRDAWDAGYEYIPDVSVMVLPSRHGVVPTPTYEAIREGIQTADLAYMVKERAGEDQ